MQTLWDVMDHLPLAPSRMAIERSFPQLIDNLCNSDPFLVLADYADYVACQERVSAAWQEQDHWTRMSILNTARGGKFSSDRAVREYSDNIWKLKPLRIALDPSLS